MKDYEREGSGKVRIMSERGYGREGSRKVRIMSERGQET